MYKQQFYQINALFLQGNYINWSSQIDALPKILKAIEMVKSEFKSAYVFSAISIALYAKMHLIL